MHQFSDIIIINAAVYTLDNINPHAEAVAIRNNRIVFVGSTQDAKAWCGPQTEVINGQRRSLLPGFIDSHFHLLWGSLELDDLQLSDAKDMDHLASLIRIHAAQLDREWIVGSLLNYNVIPSTRPLDRHFIDAIVPDRPVYLVAYDGHTVWVNTEALRRADLLQGKALPPGNEIVMDPETGLATGELRELEAFRPIRDLIPELDNTRKLALLRKGLSLASQNGITSVHNMDSKYNGVALYTTLEDLGEMTLRVYAPYEMNPETQLEALQEAAEWKYRYQGTYVRAGAIKLFMDGVIESYTALMVDGYADQPDNLGTALYSAEDFNRIVAEADRLNLQVAVHACGDGAVKRALDGYTYAQNVNGRRDSRHRIEHIEVIHTNDISRFAELNVIASMQPAHCPLSIDDDVWPSRVGRRRWPFSFPWKTLRNAGAHLAFGSDWSVTSMNPMLGFHAALNREPWAPGDPNQRQTLEDVIASYTRDAAYVEFQEHEKGIIRPGMLADLVMLSEDIFATPHTEIACVFPVLTICNGQAVYRHSFL